MKAKKIQPNHTAFNYLKAMKNIHEISVPSANTVMSFALTKIDINYDNCNIFLFCCQGVSYAITRDPLFSDEICFENNEPIILDVLPDDITQNLVRGDVKGEQEMRVTMIAAYLKDKDWTVIRDMIKNEPIFYKYKSRKPVTTNDLKIFFSKLPITESINTQFKAWLHEQCLIEIDAIIARENASCIPMDPEMLKALTEKDEENARLVRIQRDTDESNKKAAERMKAQEMELKKQYKGF